jgi:hypothetical protein
LLLIFGTTARSPEHYLLGFQGAMGGTVEYTFKEYAHMVIVYTNDNNQEFLFLIAQKAYCDELDAAGGNPGHQAHTRITKEYNDSTSTNPTMNSMMRMVNLGNWI